ncbi:MAG TPA: O-antigen ligase family protein [Solirubrobacteraceae bacterium]|jgi:O-antigen ligase|nr:O-antigen ligase family protein [Solirubrobacteraceae bacterium]
MPWRLQLRVPDGREVLTAALASAGTALIIIAAHRKLGDTAALLAPLALVLLVIVLMRPLLAVSLAIVVPVLFEGGSFGLFTFLAHVYDPVYKRLTPVDGLVLLAVVAVALDVLRDRRPLRYPRELRFPSILLALGMVSGIVVGKAGGNGLKSLVLAENLLLYLLLLPVAVANLKVDPARLRLLIAGFFGLAVFKAFLGLVEVGAHKGVSIEGSSNVTYYEPTANWVIMVALLGILAAVVARLRPPLWMLLGTPLLIASLLLSYRRSFWIAAVLGVLLVVLLALSPVGRRLLVPTALFVAAGVWLLGSINFQSENPIVKRAASLSPTSLSSSVEDRYRLDERANVLAELEQKPITGLGILVAWDAAARPLPIEHEQAREYVHFAALWWWMKMGILGLLAYFGLLFATAQMAWGVWRKRTEPIFRAFGLGSLCAVAGLLVAETTATFTGAELRFTIVFAAQIGLLALVNSMPRESPDESAQTIDAGAPAPV